MTPAEWKALSQYVTDQMKVHTRPFVTPLVHLPDMKDPLIGSGSYVDLGGPHVISCEHVLRYQPQQHQPFNSELVTLEGILRADPHPKDAALMKLEDNYWDTVRTDARLIPHDRFASAHQPVERELLFFRGWADENTFIGSEITELIPSGYCSQEKLIFDEDGHASQTGDKDIFEILWEPENTSITAGTSDDVKRRVKFDSAHGLSGALVWNTRFVEHGCDPNAWSPSMAQITGLVRRWDQKSRTILAWRVEHLHRWLSKVLPVGA